MDTLKGFADVAEHILYEMLGLLLPGGILAIAVAASVGGPFLDTVLTQAEAHPWLAFGVAYALGYPLQGLSRPISTLFEAALVFPTRLLRLLGRLAPEPVTDWIKARVEKLETELTARHAHAKAQLLDADGVACLDATVLLRSYWRRRLGLSPKVTLSDSQLRDLSFSTLLHDRRGMDRFRAAASFARGVATTVSIVTTILLVQLLSGTRELTWQMVGVLELCVILFYSLMERADMYDGGWRMILHSQFLASASAAKDFVGLETEAYGETPALASSPSNEEVLATLAGAAQSESAVRATGPITDTARPAASQLIHP